MSIIGRESNITIEPPRPDINIDFNKIWEDAQHAAEEKPELKDFFEKLKDNFGTKIESIKDKIQEFGHKVDRPENGYKVDGTEFFKENPEFAPWNNRNPNASPDYKFPGNEGHGDVLPNRPVMREDGTFGYPEGHGDTLPRKPIMKFPGNGREIPETMPEIHFDPENIDNMPTLENVGDGNVKPVQMPEVGGHGHAFDDNMPLIGGGPDRYKPIPMPRVGIQRPEKKPIEETILPNRPDIKDIFGGATKKPVEETILPDKPGIPGAKPDSPRKVGPENYLNGGDSHSRYENQLPSGWTSGAGTNSSSVSYTPDATD